MRIPFVIIAATLALSACTNRDARPPQRASAPDTARRAIPLADARWRIDSAVQGGVALAADDSSVYALVDWGRALVALDARTGHPRWRLPRPDVPLPLRFASALARTPLGALAVLDGREHRIQVVGAEGRLRETIALAPDGEPSQLCARADGGFVVQGGDARGRLVAVGPTGSVDYAVTLPWPDVDSLAPLQLQARLAATPDGASCAVALHLGRGFATVQPTTPPAARAFAYVEPVAIPATRTTVAQAGGATMRTTTLEDAPEAAASATVSEGTIAVAFAGRTRERRRLVDLYGLADGAYHGTLLHDTPILAIAAWGDRLFVLHRGPRGAELSAYDVAALLHGVAADAPRLSLAPYAGADADGARSAAR